MIVDRLDIGAGEFRDLTGWEIKPEGACKGETCVPLPGQAFDLLEVAGLLGMAVVEDEHEQLWALGPETLGGHALTTTDVSDFALPDLDGTMFPLSSLRGQKLLLVAWAPY